MDRWRHEHVLFGDHCVIHWSLHRFCSGLKHGSLQEGRLYITVRSAGVRGAARSHGVS
jgi:hypothetical protein